MVFSITLPVTLTPVLTTAPVTEMAAPAVAPAMEITAQPLKKVAIKQTATSDK
jgi:hypothetical protein